MADPGQLFHRRLGQRVEFFGIDHRRMAAQRYGAAGIASTAAARHYGQAEGDAVAHQVGDLVLAVRIDDDKGIFDAPVGGVGDMRDAGEAVELDVVAVRAAREQAQRFFAQLSRFLELAFEGLDGVIALFQQQGHLEVARGVLRNQFRGHRFFGEVMTAPFFDFGETVAHRLYQLGAPFRIVEQVVLQIGVAVDHPDIAQHLVEHARRTAGAPFLAQVEQRLPRRIAKQADHHLTVGKGRVVVGDFAKTCGHGVGGEAIQHRILPYRGATSANNPIRAKACRRFAHPRGRQKYPRNWRKNWQTTWVPASVRRAPRCR